MTPLNYASNPLLNNPKIRSTDMPEESKELVNLRARFDSHIESHREDEMEYRERQLKQDLAHEQNMEAIAALTKATKGVVDAWRTASALQRFIKWLSGFAFLGVMIAWFVGFNPFK